MSHDMTDVIKFQFCRVKIEKSSNNKFCVSNCFNIIESSMPNNLWANLWEKD